MWKSSECRETGLIPKELEREAEGIASFIVLELELKF